MKIKEKATRRNTEGAPISNSRERHHRHLGSRRRDAFPRGGGVGGGAVMMVWYRTTH